MLTVITWLRWHLRDFSTEKLLLFSFHILHFGYEQLSSAQTQKEGVEVLSLGRKSIYIYYIKICLCQHRF